MSDLPSFALPNTESANQTSLGEGFQRTQTPTATHSRRRRSTSGYDEKLSHKSMYQLLLNQAKQTLSETREMSRLVNNFAMPFKDDDESGLAFISIRADSAERHAEKTLSLVEDMIKTSEAISRAKETVKETKKTCRLLENSVLRSEEGSDLDDVWDHAKLADQHAEKTLALLEEMDKTSEAISKAKDTAADTKLTCQLLKNFAPKLEGASGFKSVSYRAERANAYAQDTLASVEWMSNMSKGSRSASTGV
jgi:hypothetical protein